MSFASRRYVTLILLAVSALSACRDEDSSSGYGWARNTRAEIESAPAWTLADTAVLRIGVLEGPDEEEFNVVQDVHLTEHRIYVLDRGNHVVRAFDREGRHLFSVGREGDGPGEFRNPVNVMPGPDSGIAVWDRSQSRLTLLSRGGEVTRTVPILSDLQNPVLRFVASDGSILLTDDRVGRPPGPEGEEPGTIPLMRYAASGELIDTLDSFTGLTMLRWNEYDQEYEPFSGSDQLAGDDEGVWTLRTDSALAVRLDPSGDTLQTIHWDPGDRRVTEAEVEAYFDVYLQLVTMNENRVEDVQALREYGMIADRHPVAAALMAVQAGRLWIKEPMRFSEEFDRPWLVFDGKGRIAARMYMPEGDVRLFDADEIHAVVRVEDALDVDRVQLRRIVPLDDDAAIASSLGAR